MIPVFEPIIGEQEIAYVVDALKKGELSGSFGSYLDQFEQRFAEYCGCEFGVAVSSGTTALHLAVAAAGIGAGDEVLVSSSTNIATALAVLHNNAIPIPVDSEDDTWNLNLDLLEGLIGPRTKAIIPVHLLGHPVDMDRLMDIAKKHNLIVIEDCAEAHGATVRGAKTGGFGDMGCFSFYANKIITTGEGGMVVTNDRKLNDKLRLLRNLAFTTPRFWHEYAGFNFRMTGYQAAMGLAQFEKIEDVIEQKRRIAGDYIRELKSIVGISLPNEMSWAKNVYWMFAIVVQPSYGISRDDLMAYLKQNGVDTRTLFCPMNQQPCVVEKNEASGKACPVADNLWKNGLYLPSTHNLSASVIADIGLLIKNAPNRVTVD